MKKIKKLKWTPYTEKLPESDHDVLVCNMYGEMKVAEYSKYDSKWYLSGFDKELDKDYDVSAWMPLPPSYKDVEYAQLRGVNIKIKVENEEVKEDENVM